MSETALAERVRRAWERGERLVAPLVGFPGVDLVGTNIKLAQQNIGVHYRTVKRLYESYGQDIVFPLMDLSVEANALGRYTLFPQDESATIPKAHFSAEDLEEMRSVDILLDTRAIGYCETVKHMNLGLPAHVIRGAYVTGPFSVAGLIMGTDEAAMATVTDTGVLRALLELVTDKITAYAHALIAAGAQLVCVLEPSAVMLGPEAFRAFSAAFVRQIIQTYRFREVATVYHVCGNCMHLIEPMMDAGVDGLSLDAQETGVDMVEVARRVERGTLLMGNLSPTGTLLHGRPSGVREEVRAMMRAMATYPAYVVSTGCDLPQNTPPENLAAFVQAAREYRVVSAA